MALVASLGLGASEASWVDDPVQGLGFLCNLLPMVGLSGCASSARVNGVVIANSRGRSQTGLERWLLEEAEKASLPSAAIQIEPVADSASRYRLHWSTKWGPDPPSELYSDEALVLVLVTAGRQLLLDELTQTPGWRALPDDATRASLLALVGGATNDLSASARRSYRRLLDASDWSGRAPRQQAEALVAMMRSRAMYDGVYRPLLASPLRATPFTLGTPTPLPGHAFKGASADARAIPVTFGDRTEPTLTVIAPLTVTEPTIIGWLTAVSRLPPYLRETVETLTFNPIEDPDNALNAAESGIPDFEADMVALPGGRVMVFPGEAPSQELVIHEAAHLWSYRHWGEDVLQGRWSAWGEAMRQDRVYPTSYARRDILEDFAEAVAVHEAVRGTPQHDEYRAMMPRRFDILEREVGRR